MGLSSSNTKLYAILLIALIIAGGSIAAIVFWQQPVDVQSINVAGSDGTTRVVTLSELQALPVVERFGSFENSYGSIRGQGEYKGAKIADIIELVGGMTESEVVLVNATDGYSQIFTYDNVYPNASWYAIQGDMILAYEYNQAIIPDYEDGPRLMFLPEDELFSNDDANVTIDHQFFSGAAGPKLVSNVAEIIITNRPETPILDVSIGVSTQSYTLDEIMEFDAVSGFGGFKNRFGTLVGPANYTGVPMQALLNDVGTLPTSYELEAVANDGYAVTYEQNIVEGTARGYDSTTGDSLGDISCTMLIAYYEDGGPIEEDGPLRIALVNDNGDLTDSYLWLKGVVTIIVQQSAPGILDVTIEESTTNYALDELMEFDPKSGLGGYKSKYGTLTGPYNFTGVAIIDLLNDAGTLPNNYELIAVANDGYSVTFDQSTVEGTTTGYNKTTGDSLGDIECTMILAYYEEGEPIDYEIPLRIAFINEDGHLTDSYLWLREVVNITVRDLGPKILNVIRGDTLLSYSLLEIMDMPSATGIGGYKKSSGTITGPYTYTGVVVEYLLNQTGDLPIQYSVEIVSDDGYTTYYNKSHIEGWFDAYNATTGDPVGLQECEMILAYYEGGEPIPSGGPLRVATINDDGYVTDGHFWAKFVVNITLIDEVEPWELELRGPQEWNMTHDVYYSLASCTHHRTEILRDGSTYTGVPLWTIISSIDGGEDVHYTFNISLAVSGYNVTLFDGLGGKANFTSVQLAGNSSILIAGWVNGSLLDSPDWPLKLVTPSGVLLGNIARIVMWGWD